MNRRRGRLAFLRSGVSSATRVCAAAMDAGLDISGTVFLTSGEATSPLDQACVQAYGRYVISEIGTIGIACRHLTGNSVHLFADAVAVIEYRRPAPFVDAEVNSLLFTSVHPDASRLYINFSPRLRLKTRGASQGRFGERPATRSEHVPWRLFFRQCHGN